MNLLNKTTKALITTLLAAVISSCATPVMVIRTPREEVAQFPLFDVHSHLTGFTAVDLLKAMQAGGITRMNVFVGEDAISAVQLAEKYRDRFVASYRPPMERKAAALGIFSPAEIERIATASEKALESGLYKGLGEVVTYRGGDFPANISPDSPIIRRLLEAAGKFGMPVNIHCNATGAQEMARVLRAYPKTIVIWAHGGSYLSPSSISDLLRDHPNLYFDLSTKHPPWTLQRFFREHILLGQVIDENWRQLFEAYPDRFLVGVDFGPGPSSFSTPLSAASETGDFFRTLLMQLSPTTARKIAYETADKLFQFKK